MSVGKVSACVCKYMYTNLENSRILHMQTSANYGLVACGPKS